MLQRRFLFFLFGSSLAAIFVLPRFNWSAEVPTTNIALQGSPRGARERSPIPIKENVVICGNLPIRGNFGNQVTVRTIGIAM